MSASDPDGIGILPELHSGYNGRQGHLGHASLYSDGWWLVYTTLRRPERREPWVRDPATGVVRKEVTTAYPLRGFEVYYWKTGIHRNDRAVELVHAFVDHDVVSHLPNEVVQIGGEWVLYKDHVHELRSRIPLSRRVRPPLFVRAFPPTADWHAHKLLRMKADDEAYFAEASRRERGRPNPDDEMSRAIALDLYKQSERLYKKLRDSDATTLANARVFRIPMGSGFVMDLELECDSSLDEKILFQVAPERGINGEQRLVPDRVRVARTVQRVCVRYEESGLPDGEWRPRSGYHDTPPGVAGTVVHDSQNFPSHVLYEGSINALLEGGDDLTYRMAKSDGTRGFPSDAAYLNGDVRGAPRGRFTTADEERLRPPSLRQVADAALVAKRWKEAAVRRAWRPKGPIAEGLKRTWGEAMGGGKSSSASFCGAGALPSLAGLRL